MNDIVWLLKFTSPDDYVFCYEVMCEAADEIDRLRKENGRLDSKNRELLYDNEQKFAEIQRLLRLQKIVDTLMKDMAQ
jgi:hypothetical protein